MILQTLHRFGAMVRVEQQNPAEIEVSAGVR
jgi:hypothetical protein